MIRAEDGLRFLVLTDILGNLCCGSAWLMDRLNQRVLRSNEGNIADGDLHVLHIRDCEHKVTMDAVSAI